MSIRRTTVLIIDLEHDQLRLTLEEAEALVRCNPSEDVDAIVDTCFEPVLEGVSVVVGWAAPVTVPHDVVEQVRAELAKEPS